MSMSKVLRGSLWAALLACMMLLTACPDPPTKAIEDAERSLLDAAAVSECAEAEFQKAEAALAEAKRLVEDGNYDEAAVKAVEAQQLADAAKAAGEANWDECQKAKNKANEDAKNVKINDDLQLQVVYFPYNESTLSEQSKSILRNNAEWLRRNPNAQLSVEGHCDSRGSTEYNIALGERRAQSVKNYLIQLGIDPSRMGIISFGEEMPIDNSSTDDGFAKNRRAEFKPR